MTHILLFPPSLFARFLAYWLLIKYTKEQGHPIPNGNNRFCKQNLLEQQLIMEDKRNDKSQ